MKRTLIATAALFAACASQAAPYGVVTLGSSKFGNDACAGVTGNCNDSSTGFKLFGGYTLMPNFAVEGGYFNFGKVTADDGAGSNETAKAEALGIGGAAHYDFTPEITGSARLGLARVTMKENGSTALTGPFNLKNTTTQPYWGLSMGYKFMPNMTVEASYDATKFEIAGAKDDVRLLGVGLRMSF